MTNTVSRRGVLVGGAAASAASCTTTSRNNGEAIARSKHIVLDDQLALINEHANYAKLGALIVGYAMDKAARLRDGDKFTKDRISVIPELEIDLVALNDCCNPYGLITTGFSKQINKLRSKKPFEYYVPTVRCNDCEPL